jgi:hypothetical protein
MINISMYPDFSWSHSRDRALMECARAYYWRYYGSHNGWQANAPENTRLAYALKQLTTFPMIVGTAVHACARDYALAVQQGSARPSFDMMLARVSDAINRAVLGSHHRASFLRDPKRVVMLQDSWYSGRNEGTGLAPVLTKARLCLRNLERTELWEELEQCPPEWVIAPEGPEAFVHEGWPVYAGPDLVYRPDGKRVVILDWKTGDVSDRRTPDPALRPLLPHRDRDPVPRRRVVRPRDQPGHGCRYGAGDHQARPDAGRGARPAERRHHAHAAGGRR